MHPPFAVFVGASGLLVILALAAVALVGRLIAGAMDKRRFQKYAAIRGWKMLHLAWEPFGRGWFGEKSDRIYEVTYQAPDGAVYIAWMKTSLFSGIYVSDTALLDPGENVAMKKSFLTTADCPRCGTSLDPGVAICPTCHRPARIVG